MSEKTTNRDKQLLYTCTSEEVKKLFLDVKCEFPLDNDIMEELNRIGEKIAIEDDDYEIFKYRKDGIDPLWSTLLEKAIKCLRHYDSREPFKGSSSAKKPLAYGIKELREYYNKYSEFERVLYGSSKYYRDHVVHVFRTWLSGIELLTKNGGIYLENINIYEKSANDCENGVIELSKAEKVSMWTIIALTHDLGYPLQTAKSIVSVTQEMVSTFVSNPDVSVDFSFHGVQNYMNDFIVRLMSSKMIYREGNNDCPYVARLQPKYYFKFQKSLEQNKHGILSTLIIYKLLTYFLESDYSINEDYRFTEEDRRQFYIRREILRSIASHTCDDVYQLYMGTFSFLLRLCDDTQEWGRKYISELYVKSDQGYELGDIFTSFEKSKDGTSNNSCSISESVTTVNEAESIVSLINRFQEQSMVYVTIFRDGQDTKLRDFTFKRQMEIKSRDKISIVLTLSINKDSASTLKGKIKYSSTGTKNSKIGSDFLDDIKAQNRLLIGQDKEMLQFKDSSTKWSECAFDIPLYD